MPLLGTVRERSLPGVKVADLLRLPDERGVFTEVFRLDWKDLLNGDQVSQLNFSVTYPGIVRAWHRHLRGQVDYFLVLKGSIKVCAYDDAEGSPTRGYLVETVLSGERLQILRVPGLYWHGFKAVGLEPAYLLYFVNRLYDYEEPDEERRPWNDDRVIPVSINGRSDDPRVGKPWNWFEAPHR